MKQIEEFLHGIFPIIKEIDEGYFGKTSAQELSSPKGQAALKEYAQFLIEEVGEIYETKVNVPISSAPTLDEIADVLGFLHALVIRCGAGAEIYNEALAFKPTTKVVKGSPELLEVVENGEVKQEARAAVPDRTITTFPVTGEGENIRYKGAVGFHAMLDAEVGAILFQPVFETTMLCNILKNRKWKKENYPVDNPAFAAQLKVTYNSYIEAIFKLGYTLKDIKAGFEKKTSTNLKRIKENY